MKIYDSDAYQKSRIEMDINNGKTAEELKSEYGEDSPALKEILDSYGQINRHRSL